MATLLHSEVIETGTHKNTGVILDQTTWVVIVNTDLENDQVAPWGYANYMSIDTPINNGNIKFYSVGLFGPQTMFAPMIPFVPQANIWIYVSNQYYFGDAPVQIWSPFDPT